MTTRPELTEIEVALKDLVVHDLNARAGSPEAYEADDIPVLAASIATLGLLNPLIVQKVGKHWGVIAGGRRRAALLHLVNDKSAKGWTMRSKVTCRAIAGRRGRGHRDHRGGERHAEGHGPARRVRGLRADDGDGRAQPREHRDDVRRRAAPRRGPAALRPRSIPRSAPPPV